MQPFEKAGAFYLGRLFDAAKQSVGDELYLYDSKDLTTHAVCVGMTGSGKTGLCVTLLEEAAIDGIPALVIDPKGDLGNLALTFPTLSTAEFQPWIDPGAAQRKGKTVEQFARSTAELWKNGLADWGQDGARIARLKESAEVAIYTPGSEAGRPLKVLRSLNAPGAALLEDRDAVNDRIQSTVSGLLGLLGIDADPIRSREHILLSNILQHAWSAGRNLDLPTLIREIQSPGFDRIGVLDLESFYDQGQRFELAMSLNNLLASPGFGAWMQGEPLDVAKLLWTPAGKPRIAILSIAHLSDAQRMFFVTLLLGEVLAWMRSQPGTSSLRALLYMDEVFGFFPPSANPPSKTPMLTLLKQARAFGLGVVLATQNPVDLDYKGLSNTGTWFLGRLQTERDKKRVLDGLEGASASAGAVFDRARIETILSGLGSRVFLVNNVHEEAPLLFHTRWAMSYLRGPLTRAQIRELSAGAPAPAEPETLPAAAVPAAPAAPPVAADTPPAPSAVSAAPVLPPGIDAFYLAPNGLPGPGQRLLYRPALIGSARLHYVSARAGIDAWDEASLRAALGSDNAHDPWEGAADLDEPPELLRRGEPGAAHGELPPEATRSKSYTAWKRGLKDHLYRTRTMNGWRCKALKVTSESGESEQAFRGRLALAVREKRDLELAKLEKRYQPKLKRVQDAIRRAEHKVAREKEQYGQQKVQTAISIGATVLGALLGRKAVSTGTVGKATTAVRGMGRAARERGDISRAAESLQAQQVKLEELSAEFEELLAEVRDRHQPESYDVETTELRPRKADIGVDRMHLVWTPWRVDADGLATPLF